MGDGKNEIVRHKSNSGHYVIAGDPIPWARAGCNFKKRIIFDMQKPLKYVIEAHLLEQHNGRPLFQGPLELAITFYLRIPKVTKAKKTQLLGSWYWTKPDLSNLVKLIEDIGNGVLYRDDCQFARCITEKKYDEEPRTEFTITELK